MDNQYPGNSDRGQELQSYQKRVDKPVVNGATAAKEKTVWNSIEEFFGLGECKSFRDYVGALSDMTNRVYGAIDTLLGNRKYQNTTVPAARVQYSSYYNNPVQQPQQAPAQQQQARLDGYGQYYITYDLREDAEVVLASMIEMLGIYKNVSIGDMFDLSGLTDPHGYTNVKYGWKSLDGVRVIPYGSKWAINVPSAGPIP